MYALVVMGKEPCTGVYRPRMTRISADGSPGNPLCIAVSGFLVGKWHGLLAHVPTGWKPVPPPWSDFVRGSRIKSAD